MREQTPRSARRGTLTVLAALATMLAVLSGAALGPVGAADAADSTVTSFAFTSDSGDFIGQGQSLSYTPANATFSIGGTAVW